MRMMGNSLMLFISLAVGYVVCVLAQMQKNTLKTVGYTIGIAIITLALLYGAADSMGSSSIEGKSICGKKAMKCYPGANYMKMHHK